MQKFKKECELIISNPKSDELNELDSTCGISDDELTERFKEAIRIENEIKKLDLRINKLSNNLTILHNETTKR